MQLAQLTIVDSFTDWRIHHPHTATREDCISDGVALKSACHCQNTWLYIYKYPPHPADDSFCPNGYEDQGLGTAGTGYAVVDISIVMAVATANDFKLFLITSSPFRHSNLLLLSNKRLIRFIYALICMGWIQRNLCKSSKKQIVWIKKKNKELYEFGKWQKEDLCM